MTEVVPHIMFRNGKLIVRFSRIGYILEVKTGKFVTSGLKFLFSQNEASKKVFVKGIKKHLEIFGSETSDLLNIYDDVQSIINENNLK